SLDQIETNHCCSHFPLLGSRFSFTLTFHSAFAGMFVVKTCTSASRTRDPPLLTRAPGQAHVRSTTGPHDQPCAAGRLRPGLGRSGNAHREVRARTTARVQPTLSVMSRLTTAH